MKKKDVSYLWHCSDEVLDYNDIVDNKLTAANMNKALALGYRLALRDVEEAGLIEMGDIDRLATEEDRVKKEKVVGYLVYKD